MPELEQGVLDGWESDLDYAFGKFSKSFDFPSAQERVKEVRDDIQNTSVEEVDQDTLESWHSDLDYAYGKFSKSFDFPSAQERVQCVRDEIETYIN